MFVLSSRIRRIAYVLLFEAIAIVLSTLILNAITDGSHNSLPIAVAISVSAVIWNYIYNSMFEVWERRTKRTERTIVLRFGHAIGFEGGLLILVSPLYMFWYNVSLLEAFSMEAVLLAFFFVFTFVFTWIFDLVFALPHENVRVQNNPIL